MDRRFIVSTVLKLLLNAVVAWIAGLIFITANLYLSRGRATCRSAKLSPSVTAPFLTAPNDLELISREVFVL